jgi:4-hydroxybenzoate polyprenyltransferase
MAALLAVLPFFCDTSVFYTRIPFEEIENYKQQLGVFLRMPPFVLLLLIRND